MAIKTNTGTMSKAFFGTSAVKKMYFGSSLVFSASTPYYTAGTENVDWIKGSSVGTVTFGASYMSVSTSSTQTAVDSYAVTNVLVNLTNINTLKIDWAGSIYQQIIAGMYLCISTTKLGTYGTYNARLSGGSGLDSFARRTDSLDVSGLTGNYYLRIHAQKSSSSVVGSASLTIYNVWGE